MGIRSSRLSFGYTEFEVSLSYISQERKRKDERKTTRSNATRQVKTKANNDNSKTPRTQSFAFACPT